MAPHGAAPWTLSHGQACPIFQVTAGIAPMKHLRLILAAPCLTFFAVSDAPAQGQRNRDAGATLGAGAATIPGEELKKFGLLGTWAWDCSRPPDNRNPYTTYDARPDGSATRTLRMQVSGLDGVNRIGAAHYINDRRLELSWTQNGITFQIVFTKDERGRYRSVESVGSDGKTYIRDGRFTNDNSEVTWFTKCNSPAS
jgi:hypothetical protein